MIAAADVQTAPTRSVVVPYTRFLERRAWRAKIAADFQQLSSFLDKVHGVEPPAATLLRPVPLR